MTSTASAETPRSTSSRVVAITIVLTVVVAAVGWGLRERFLQNLGGPSAPAASASPAASGSAKAPPPPMVVDGIAMLPHRVATTASATGTLLAREQVDLVAEVSRRVVKVNAKDGATVKKGDVLFVLDAADLGAQARTLEVRRQLAVENEKRAKRLAEGGLASAQELERIVAERALVEAQLAELGVTMSRSSIRAPFAGRLGLVQVSEGAWVSPATKLATLQDLEKVRVDFALPERYAPSLAPGGRFTFRVPGREETYEGTIVAVEPRIDAATRSVTARGLAENPGRKLLPGGFVAVELELTADEQGLVVPSVAVMPTGGGHAVFVAKDGKAVEAKVEIGVRTDTTVQILKGLSPGDVVLTSNLLRLRPGAPIKLGKVEGGAPPAAPAAGSAAPAAGSAAPAAGPRKPAADPRKEGTAE